MADDEDPDEADPFDSLDPEEFRDRPGDPFDHLGEGSDERPGESHDRAGGPAGDSGSGPAPEDDREVGPERSEEHVEKPGFGEDHRRADTDASEDSESDGVRSDVGLPSGDPYVDGNREGSPFESGGSAFTEVDVDRIDADEVWESLTDAESEGSVEDLEDETVEVSKHSYCETCEHFSPPPDVHCTHDGTKILEFVDMDKVRVVNCPIVANRRELGHEEAEDVE